jgi:hypothetical protein
MGLGSGIRKKPIPDSGSKRHRIRIRNTAFFYICRSIWPSWIRIQQLKLMRIRIHNPAFFYESFTQKYDSFILATRS